MASRSPYTCAVYPTLLAPEDSFWIRPIMRSLPQVRQLATARGAISTRLTNVRSSIACRIIEALRELGPTREPCPLVSIWRSPRRRGSVAAICTPSTVAHGNSANGNPHIVTTGKCESTTTVDAARQTTREHDSLWVMRRQFRCRPSTLVVALPIVIVVGVVAAIALVAVFPSRSVLCRRTCQCRAVKM
jgi:hypothetical protein